MPCMQLDFWIENGEEFEQPPAEKAESGFDIWMIFHSMPPMHPARSTRSATADGSQGATTFIVRLANNDRGDLVLNPILVELERQILRAPETLGIYTADLVNRRKAEPDNFKPMKLASVVNQFADTFYQARSALFAAIADGEEGTGVVEVTDLHAHGDKVAAYVHAYVDLLTERALASRALPERAASIRCSTTLRR